MSSDPGHRSSLVALFLRILWLVLGPVVLFALAGLIAQRRGYSVIDIWFAAGVAIVLFARFLDIARFGGTTPEGAPATMSHFRGYSLKLVMAAAAGWLLAHWLPSAA